MSDPCSSVQRAQEEVLIPFCNDRRHPPDCLFLVAESDFRFYQADCAEPTSDWRDLLAEGVGYSLGQAFYRGSVRAREEAQRQGVGGAAGDGGAAQGEGRPRAEPPVATEPTAGAPAAAAAGGAAAGARQASGSAVPPLSTEPTAGSAAASSAAAGDEAAQRVRDTLLGAFSDGLRRTKRQRDGFLGWSRHPPPCYPSQELRDLVRLATAAHRCGRGNIIWLGYEARNSAGLRTMPSYGSSLIAVTAAGARAFGRHLETVPPDHLDIILRAWLTTGDTQVSVGASFVYPSAGSYESHASGCDPGIGVRTTKWSAAWIGQGFRSGDAKRYLAGWRPKGGAEWLTEPLNLDDPGLAWRTEQPPNSVGDPRIQWRLWERWWVWADGTWRGPEVDERSHRGAPRTEPTAGRGGRAREANSAANFKRLLRDDPEGHRSIGHGMLSPISRLAEQLVTDPVEADSEPMPDPRSRAGRARRRNVAAYLRRRFVPAPAPR